jgi:predicted phage terminase large subunit-like protein
LAPEFGKYSKALESLSGTPQQQQKVLRRIATHDLYFLAKQILGFWWLCTEPHQSFCREIEKNKHLTLYLLPRGHAKTQCFTVAHSIQLHLQHPDRPIAIVCDALKRSVKKTRAIKWQLEHNVALRELFPDKIWADPQSQSPKWTDEEFVLPGHDGRQEPSFQATSLENQPTGLHFPVIKCDDVVTPETCTTRDQIEKNKTSFGLMRSSILQAGGNLQLCGTIYDDGDLYCEMSREGTGYTVYKRPAIDPKTGKALWPEQFNLDVLNAIRKDPLVTEYIFSCQYLLDPAPEDERSYFKLRDFGRYRELPEHLNYYTAIDFALSENQKADWTVIMVAGVDYKGRIYIVDVRKGHWESLDTANNMINTQRDYRDKRKPILVWACQSDMIKKAIGPFLRVKMLEEKVFLNIQDSMPMKDKEANARSIQGRIKEGAVFLPERGINQPEWLADLEFEVRRFPRGAHDDHVDCLAYIGLLMDQLASADNKKARPKLPSDSMIDAIETPLPRSEYEDMVLHEALDPMYEDGTLDRSDVMRYDMDPKEKDR